MDNLFIFLNSNHINIYVLELLFKVVKPGPGQPRTGPVESIKSGIAKNWDKIGHSSVESVTRSTRCRVIRFLLFFFPPLIIRPNQNNPVPMLIETFNIVGP